MIAKRSHHTCLCRLVRRPAYTLIEMIAAMVVLSFIASSASLVLGRMAVTYHDRSLQGQLHLEADVALSRIVRELRGIDAIVDENGEYVPAIDQASRHAVSWNDGSSIRLDGSRVLINTDGTNTDCLATDVSSLVFDYLDDDHRPLAVGDAVAPEKVRNIRRISILLVISRGGCSERFHTLVFIRSMMRFTN